MRPTHTQGVEPCAASPVSLNSLYLGLTSIILSYWQTSVNSRDDFLTHHFRREFEHAIRITFDSYWTTRPIPVTAKSRMRSLNAFPLFCQRVCQMCVATEYQHFFRREDIEKHVEKCRLVLPEALSIGALLFETCSDFTLAWQKKYFQN